MASMALSGALSYKILRFRPVMARSKQSMRAFSVDPRSIQRTPVSKEKSPMEQAADTEEIHEAAAINTTKGDASSIARAGAEQVENTAEAAANQAIGIAQEIGDRAKQTVQDAWGSAKETAQRVKDTVVGKSEDAADTIKENAENVKRSMNTKNSS